MVDLVYYLTSLLFFVIPLLYYYINLRSSIIFPLFPGDIYLSLSCSISSASFVTVPKLLCDKFLETFVIL